MASKDMKGFYKQKKKTTASKPSSSSTTKKPRKSATLGSGDPPQTPALVSHGSYDLDDEYGEEEMKLRRFDMDIRYGPCIGLTRLERLERAKSMGLNPPQEIEQILLRAGNDGPGLECLWEGRV
ncbi:uncharacterized protein A4U43_C10F410 [Asparagus officinalis]|uniref:DNA polymerase delta subunit 4 n=1 Tax=Asparagus officinalis TaxID=4686 RepID=A0A5P1DZH8_ASPOF|nr:DNA polymerase delta subunit 4 [Asparagus officinalis]ONK55730.1 uncharacterized protein A4U43_C10F410 [Asparagus officinalis]